MIIGQQLGSMVAQVEVEHIVTLVKLVLGMVIIGLVTILIVLRLIVGGLDGGVELLLVVVGLGTTIVMVVAMTHHVKQEQKQ